MKLEEHSISRTKILSITLRAICDKGLFETIRILQQNLGFYVIDEIMYYLISVA